MLGLWIIPVFAVTSVSQVQPFSSQQIRLVTPSEFNHQIPVCALGYKMKGPRIGKTCNNECIPCEGERFSDSYNVEMSCKVCETCDKREYFHTCKRTVDVSATKCENLHSLRVLGILAKKCFKHEKTEQ